MVRFHRTIAVIWLIFTAIFFGMAMFHWHLSGESAPDLSVAFRPGAQSGSVVILGTDVDQPLRDFAANFNDYVHSQNESSHTENLMAMWGYLLAAFVSLVSLTIEIAEIREQKTKMGGAT